MYPFVEEVVYEEGFFWEYIAGQNALINLMIRSTSL